MSIMGAPSSELQQYLHLEGHPSVGMIIMWKGFFIACDVTHLRGRYLPRKEILKSVNAIESDALGAMPRR